jgi:hypothetical protein
MGSELSWSCPLDSLIARILVLPFKVCHSAKLPEHCIEESLGWAVESQTIFGSGGGFTVLYWHLLSWSRCLAFRHERQRFPVNWRELHILRRG